MASVLPLPCLPAIVPAIVSGFSQCLPSVCPCRDSPGRDSPGNLAYTPGGVMSFPVLASSSTRPLRSKQSRPPHACLTDFEWHDRSRPGKWPRKCPREWPRACPMACPGRRPRCPCFGRFLAMRPASCAGPPWPRDGREAGEEAWRTCVGKAARDMLYGKAARDTASARLEPWLLLPAPARNGLRQSAGTCLVLGAARVLA